MVAAERRRCFRYRLQKGHLRLGSANNMEKILIYRGATVTPTKMAH